jgi:hypothetical protein
MSYSHLCETSNSIAKDICRSEKAVGIINSVIPTVAGVVTKTCTGNELAGAAANAAASAIIKSVPTEAAEFVTAVGVGVAIDVAAMAAMPVVLVVGAGYLAYAATKKVGSFLDDLFS